MIGSLVAALAGKDIEEADGGSGAAGALIGVAGWALVKRVAPLAVVVAGVLVAKHYLERAGLDERG